MGSKKVVKKKTGKKPVKKAKAKSKAKVKGPVTLPDNQPILPKEDDFDDMEDTSTKEVDEDEDEGLF